MIIALNTFFEVEFSFRDQLVHTDGMMVLSTKIFKGSAIIINFENFTWRHQKFLLRLFKYFDKF